ncbi:MAG TPA: hypothetical protein VII78_00470 [Myxococcota bacterium]|jgi:hypothetical protein
MAMRRFHALLFAAVASAPLSVHADGAGPVRAPHASEAPRARSAEHGDCYGNAPLARVASATGEVRALAPGGGSRALSCDDAVNACEAIVTGPGASIGLLVDDALVQLGPDSRAQLSARPAPEVALERGSVRVVDERDEAAQRVQLYTPTLSASTSRGDAEMARDGDHVRVCAHDEAVVVMAHDGARTLAAGRCFESGGSGALASSPAGAASVPIGDAASCPFIVAGLPRVIPPVSGAPPDGPGIDPFDAPGRDSCDGPGSGCAAVRTIADDPDPGTGCGMPGSPCGGE